MNELNTNEVQQMKRCSNKNCKDPVKPITEFPKNKASKDGHSHWCKQCHADYRRARHVKMTVVEPDTDNVEMAEVEAEVLTAGTLD